MPSELTQERLRKWQQFGIDGIRWPPGEEKPLHPSEILDAYEALLAERDELKEKLEDAREQASDMNLERERAVMTAKSMMGRWGTLCKALDRAEAAGVIEGPVCQSELEMATVMDRAGEYKQRCERLERACQSALNHVRELREAWMAGALHERDGRGGERSNRNVDVESELAAALAAVESEGQDAGQQTTQN